MPIFDGTHLEWAYANAECLERRGFNMFVDESVPNWQPRSLPNKQIDAYNAAYEECLSEIGQPSVPALTEAGVRAVYEEYVAAGECLRELGYQISDPPSEDVFVDTWDKGPWVPHAELPDMPEGEWREVEEKCPQPGMG